MKKILLINTSDFNKNGIVSVIMNYSKNINKECIQLDLVAINEIEDALKKECKQEFNNIYEFSSKKKHLFRYLYSLYRIMKKNSYDVVHIHGNSAMMLFELMLAKYVGISVRIAHCHNDSCDHPVVNDIIKPIFYSSYTVALACSKQAGNWLFGNRKYMVLPNAIESERYIYNEINRKEIRRMLKVKDEEFLIGHIGLFNIQKNQEFLINVAKVLKDKSVNFKLLLIGEGPLKEKIKTKVSEYDLDQNIIFAGTTNKIEKYLSAMDLFVFPSKWEGFGLALLEAQSNGLECVVSDRVSEEINLSGNIKYLSIDNSLGIWSQEIINYINKSNNERMKKSIDNIRQIKENNLDIRDEANVLKNIYIKGGY